LITGWYTETVPNNRMTLSLRSSIHSETTWALDRLCRLVHNDQFSFRTIPGVIDALFDWPLWYVTEGFKHVKDSDVLFSSSPALARQCRFALESLFVLRNGALHEPNARDLYAHRNTMQLILYGLHNLDHSADENVEALLHIIDIFNVVASKLHVVVANPPRLNPIPPLLRIASESQNRTMIMSSLEALSFLLTNPMNAVHLSPKSPALTAGIRYLPLIGDKALIESCLNYLHCHISHPFMARSFLLHPEMPNVLRILTSLILHEQHGLEKTFTLDKSGPVYAVPSSTQILRNHELSQEELEELLAKPEPERCYDWYVNEILKLSAIFLINNV
jgi:chromatin structure-remodeling complex subunit RSC9